MGAPNPEFSLEISPESRLDVIDVRTRVGRQFGDVLTGFRKALYCSYHTTAGYFDQRLCERFNYNREALRDFVGSFQRLFPPNADYSHDQLQLRTELSEDQKREEPLNADSHLTYIGAGLANCVTYTNSPTRPVFFVDLDGVYRDKTRKRRTTVIAFNRERRLAELRLMVPVSSHPIDSISLKDGRLGVFEQLQALVERYEIDRGRIDISLAADESHAGLTVNEYETLLMKHDLTEVLRNPFRFMAQKGLHMLGDPKAIPGKALNYAKYDLVQVVNELLDKMGLSESLVERVIDKFLAFPAARFLWMKRSVSLLVSGSEENGHGPIIEGTYQSPVLVQWKKAQAQTRRLNVTLVRFE